MVKKTYQSIQAEILKLQKEAEALRAQEIAEVIAKIKPAIAAYGLTAADLGLSKPTAAPTRPATKSTAKRGIASKKTKAVKSPKYRDQTGNSWIGIGKRPAWFNAALAAGKTPEDLLAK